MSFGYNSLMESQQISLPDGKKIFFASDFHLGVPDAVTSLAREKKVVRWLESVRKDAHIIYLLGDIFDFWFEYKFTIPKGFIRLQGKLAELRDAGIEIAFFTGNHDMWMFDYFPKELGIPIHREPIELIIGTQKMIIGHGDGLGPGETSYKFLKAFFNSKICQWLFARIHPNLGMSIANYWSRQSRISNMKREEKFNGAENEYLFVWCREYEKKSHHDYYLFGHRHLSLDLALAADARYVNTGEWVHGATYAVYNGSQLELKRFES